MKNTFLLTLTVLFITISTLSSAGIQFNYQNCLKRGVSSGINSKEVVKQCHNIYLTNNQRGKQVKLPVDF